MLRPLPRRSFPRLSYTALLCAFSIIPLAFPLPARAFQEKPAATTGATRPVRKTLPSGLRLIVAARPGTRLIALDLRVLGGSGEETPQSSGLAHFVEHLVFKGGEGQQPGEIDQSIETLGGELSARTTRDATEYRTLVPQTAWRPALQVMADMVLKPAFRPEDLNEERAVVRAEMRVALSEPPRAGFAAVATHSFAADGGYALPLMGSPENLARFTVDDLRASWRRAYRPANMILTVVGDVSPDEVEKAAAALFVSPGKGEGISAVSVLNPTAGVAHTGTVRLPSPPPSEQLEGKLATVVVGYRTPGVAGGDAARLLAALDVLMYLLGTSSAGTGAGDLGRGLLYEGLVREKPRALALTAEYTPGRRAGLILVTATVQPSHASTFDDTLTAELRRIREDLLTDTAVVGAREAVAAQIGSADEFPEALARRLARMEALGMPPGLADAYADELRKITTDDVKRVWGLYVTPLRCVVATFGTPPPVAPETASVGEAAP